MESVEGIISWSTRKRSTVCIRERYCNNLVAVQVRLI